jgi:hypothetical protein
LELRKRDIERIVAALPSDVVQQLQDREIFLAGGFIRDVLTHRTPHDIDLFGPTEALLGVVRDLGWSCYTERAVTLRPDEGLPIQCVTGFPVTDPQELIDRFNFTVNQAVLWYSQADETWVSLCSNDFYLDLAHGLLEPNPLMVSAAPSLVKLLRLLKDDWDISVDALMALVAMAAYTELKGSTQFTTDELTKKLIATAEGDSYECLTRETSALDARSNSIPTDSFPELLDLEALGSTF